MPAFFFSLYLNRIRLNSAKFISTRTKIRCQESNKTEGQYEPVKGSPQSQPFAQAWYLEQKKSREVGKNRNLVGLFYSSSVVEVVQHDQAVHKVSMNLYTTSPLPVSICRVPHHYSQNPAQVRAPLGGNWIQLWNQSCDFLPRQATALASAWWMLQSPRQHPKSPQAEISKIKLKTTNITAGSPRGASEENRPEES